MSFFSGGRRTYSSSEFPGISRGKGMGRISRSGILTSAKIYDSIRSHRAGAASTSVTVGGGRHPRRRLLGSINERALGRALAVLGAVVVVGLGVMLIVTAAKSGGRQIADIGTIDTVDGDVITADDTGATVTIALGGSIKLQDEIISAAATGEGYDFNNYLSELKSVMTADVSIVSLSGTVDGSSAYTGYPRPNYPVQLVDSLANIGVNYAACSSGFTMEGGPAALSATVGSLEGGGVTPVGVRANPATGSTYSVRRVNSVCIGVGSYNCVAESELNSMISAQTSAGFTADQIKGCVNQLDISKASETIRADVDAMRAAGAKFIIICINWGSADLAAPNYDMRSLAQDMIDYGVDVTLGYGSDVMQKITVKKHTDEATGASKNCYVFYSLGNLFSDFGAGSAQSKQETMVINFTLERAAGSGDVTVSGAYYHPVYINRDETYAAENTYLKYRVVPAARYVDAETLPEVFSTGAQWEKCITTFSDIRQKFQDDWAMNDYFVLGTVEKIDSITDNSSGEDAHL